MKLSDSDLVKLYALAMKAADRAGTYIQKSAGRHRETNSKEAGNTPASQVVTEVDVESQRIIVEILGDSIDEYQLGLLTEESEDNSSRLEMDYFWCIDPLDGTLPFVEGKPGYSVSIALVSREGEALLGVINDPAKGEVYHALRGNGAFKYDDRILSSSTKEGTDLTWIMDRSMKTLEAYPSVVKSMERLAGKMGYSGLTLIDYAGAVLNGSWVTQCSPAVYFKFPKPEKGGGCLWDFAATACLLSEWGQPAIDVFGTPLDLNRADSTFMNERGVIYASNTDLRCSIQRIFLQACSDSVKV